jgi:hypothetical protein
MLLTNQLKSGFAGLFFICLYAGTCFSFSAAPPAATFDTLRRTEVAALHNFNKKNILLAIAMQIIQ